jgi:hypothetical protein
VEPNYLFRSSAPFTAEEFWLSLLHTLSSAAHEQDSDVAVKSSSGSANLDSFPCERIPFSKPFLDLLRHKNEIENITLRNQRERERENKLHITIKL